MALYIKYRPKKLSQVMGNEELKSSLQGMLEKGNVPHSILLHGPTGCGKTTIGRILAKELGAVGFNYKEMDIADFRGIDTVREIRKQAQLKALDGGVRVYLLDEAHKLTGDAQNALLKILEDTPTHVYFILATTNPEKLIKTVRGRCSSFQVRTLTEDEMGKTLKRIVKREKRTLSDEIYEQIAEDSLGHPRNAIQILEQVLNADEDKQLEVAKRQAEINSESIELARALLAGKGWKTISTILKGLKQEDPEGIRRMILGYASAVLLNKDSDKAGLVLEEMLEPFYNTNFPGLVYACFSITKN